MAEWASLLAALAAGVALYISFKWLEGSKLLYLPAPSFKAVGPGKIYRLPAKEKGIYAPNTVLQRAQRLFKTQVLGSESVAVSGSGELYMLDRYGYVLRPKRGDTSAVEKVAHLGPGRPLGFQFDAANNLLICNAGTGLQVVEKMGSGERGATVLLASQAPTSRTGAASSPIHFANDLAIARDGGVFFSDSSTIPPALNSHGYYDAMASFMLTIVQGEHSGRLLHLSADRKKVSFICGDLFFANGVVLAKDESYVLVAETAACRITKVWLKGEKAGQKEVFLDNMPGYPDGLIEGVDGSYWISLVRLAQPALAMFMKTRVLRWLAAWLPAWMKQPSPGTAVLQVSAEGKVLRYMADPKDKVVSTVTAVFETKDGLYLGNVEGDFVSFLRKSDYSPILST